MVFLPLHDSNQLKFIPFQWGTACLILLNVAIFVWQSSLGERGVMEFANQAGMIPVTLFGSVPLPPEYLTLSPEMRLVTYMFLHGDIWHILGNMLFLYVFGDNVEDAMGTISFVAFYLICGIAAGVAHGYMNPASEAPLIGASGATAGIIGAYLMLYPRVGVWVLVFMRIPLKLPALVVLAAWIVMQIGFVLAEVNDGTAWWAHLGGFAAGVVLVFMFKRPEVPLFGGAPQR